MTMEGKFDAPSLEDPESGLSHCLIQAGSDRGPNGPPASAVAGMVVQQIDCAKGEDAARDAVLASTPVARLLSLTTRGWRECRGNHDGSMMDKTARGSSRLALTRAANRQERKVTLLRTSDKKGAEKAANAKDREVSETAAKAENPNPKGQQQPDLGGSPDGQGAGR
jgi:hypothetical protein